MVDDSTTKTNVRSRMSMRDKLIDKQKTNQEHTRNWGAGRVTIHERYLHRTGIRGRKRFLLFSVLFLVFLLCLINLIILSIALSRLRIDSTGMKHLSFLSDGKLRWTHGGDLKYVWLQDGELKTFKDMDLTLEGLNNKVYLNSGSLVHLGVGKGEVSVQAECFKFVVPGEEKTVLSICQKEAIIEAPISGTQVLDELITPRVTSKADEDFNLIATNGSAVIQGNEGIFMDSKTLNIEAMSNITLTSRVDSSMTLDGKEGIVLSNKNMPTSGSGPIKTVETYKLCACTSGLLFKIRVDGAQKVCADYDGICA